MAAPGHFGLAMKDYTHSTAPNRRYPDLIVHRLLRAVLAGKPTPAEEELNPIADECSQSERRAADAERELTLELGAPRAQNAHPGGCRSVADGVEHGGLADPGGAFYDHEAAVPSASASAKPPSAAGGLA